jgi:hypothetical protein
MANLDIVRDQISFVLISRPSSDVPVVVNSPVYTLTVIDAESLQHIFPTEPVTFEFRQMVSVNRTNPQCVYWKTNKAR